MADEAEKIDDYELLNCIASGSTTQIWEVVKEGSSDHYAMKLILPEAMKDPVNKQVLKHEAKVHASLDHPSFVRFHKVVVNKHHAYLLMDYFRAANLKTQLLTDLSGLQSRLRRLVESLCLGLGYMHQQGWVHKDIKPENILGTKGSEVRIIDFSLSTRFASGIGKLFVGKSSIIQGTRTYIAPETIMKQAVSPQTDMYSMGIMLFEILAGQPPFTGSSPNELLMRHLKEKPAPPSHYNKNVTPEADAVIARLLEKKPAKRFQEMNEIYAEFRSLKIFKTDPQELATAKVAKDHAMAMDGLDEASRLDSRADHLRSQSGEPREPAKPKAKPKAPPPPEKKPAPAAAAGKPKATEKPAAPAATQPPRPAAPGMAPYPPPFPPPGYPQPGFPPGYVPQPGAPMPFPQPGQPIPYPPGYAVASGPGMPQPGMPPQGMPQPPWGPQSAFPPQPGAFPPVVPGGSPQPSRPVVPQSGQHTPPPVALPSGAVPPMGNSPGRPVAQPSALAPGMASPGPPPAGSGDRSAEEALRGMQYQAELAAQRAAAQKAAGAALRAPSQIPNEERHISQKDADADLPLMDELPDIS